MSSSSSSSSPSMAIPTVSLIFSFFIILTAATFSNGFTDFDQQQQQPKTISGDLCKTYTNSYPTYDDINHTVVSMDQQMVVEALLSTRYKDWVRILCTIHPSEFPTNATFLVSSSDNPMSDNHQRFVFLRTRIMFKGFVSRYYLDFTLRYNIVPRYLPFSELQKIEIGSEIPTYFLEPTSIQVTNNSESNYTLDGIRIVHPDLYLSGSVAVHGIESSLKPKGWSFLERFVTTCVLDLLMDIVAFLMAKWIYGIRHRRADRRLHPHAD